MERRPQSSGGLQGKKIDNHLQYSLTRPEYKKLRRAIYSLTKDQRGNLQRQAGRSNLSEFEQKEFGRSDFSHALAKGGPDVVKPLIKTGYAVLAINMCWQKGGNQAARLAAKIMNKHEDGALVLSHFPSALPLLKKFPNHQRDIIGAIRHSNPQAVDALMKLIERHGPIVAKIYATTPNRFSPNAAMAQQRLDAYLNRPQKKPH